MQYARISSIQQAIKDGNGGDRSVGGDGKIAPTQDPDNDLIDDKTTETTSCFGSGMWNMALNLSMDR